MSMAKSQTTHRALRDRERHAGPSPTRLDINTQSLEPGNEIEDPLLTKGKGNISLEIDIQSHPRPSTRTKAHRAFMHFIPPHNLDRVVDITDIRHNKYPGANESLDDKLEETLRLSELIGNRRLRGHMLIIFQLA